MCIISEMSVVSVSRPLINQNGQIREYRFIRYYNIFGYFSSFFREVVNEEKKEIFNSIRLLEKLYI